MYKIKWIIHVWCAFMSFFDVHFSKTTMPWSGLLFFNIIMFCCNMSGVILHIKQAITKTGFDFWLFEDEKFYLSDKMLFMHQCLSVAIGKFIRFRSILFLATGHAYKDNPIVYFCFCSYITRAKISFSLKRER